MISLSAAQVWEQYVKDEANKQATCKVLKNLEDPDTGKELDQLVPCGKVIAMPDSSNSGCRRHLERMHPKFVQEILAKQALNNGTILSFFKPGSAVGYNPDTFLRYAVDTYQPLDTCEDPDFRLFIDRVTAGRADHFGRNTVHQRLLGTTAIVRAQVCELLRGRRLCATTDGWTSCNSEKYNCLTVSFIDADFQLHTYQLGIEMLDGKHTGERVAQSVVKLLADCGILPAQVTALTTDSAASMVACHRRLKEQHGMDSHMCFAHLLELVTGHFFEVPAVKETLKAAGETVSWYHGSASRQAALFKWEETLGEGHLKLIRDVETRWWSTWAMCERLLRLKRVLQTMASAKEGPDLLTEVHWRIIEMGERLLKPFMQVQKLLEGEKYVTASYIPMVIDGLRKSLDAAAKHFATEEAGAGAAEDGEERAAIAAAETDACAAVRQSARIMLTDFCERFGNGVVGNVCRYYVGPRRRYIGIPPKIFAASALDPRFKVLQGIPVQEHLQVWTLVDKYLYDSMVRVEQEAAALSAAAAPPVIAVDADEESQVEPEEGDDGGGAKRKRNDLPDFFGGNLQADAAAAIMHACRGRLVIAPDESAEAREQRIRSTINHEIATYQQLPYERFDPASGEYGDPLSWWAGQRGLLPNLARLARELLPIPATSAASERVFSTAGLTIDKRRNRLSADTAADLVFLHGSWGAVEKHLAKKTAGGDSMGPGASDKQVGAQKKGGGGKKSKK